ncbi:FKBP-type peptidyl-prolyl cis-trans isomerase [Flavicella sediminum]|uniref:FKBP-type peptidyl-prolyl cis-trans isomerase n=1 Tax=Flavicella sediminum TaxID=2585141 RepID=UPI00111D0BC5|nr:FKBP-type peptidyl-prolyl cis-trans isomerase [Flavicella sediminum]
MNLIKNFCQLLLIAVLIISCDTGSTLAVDNFDHEGQITIDNDSLVGYLKTHYYNTNDDAILTIGDGGEADLPLADQKAIWDVNLADDNLVLEHMTGIEVADVDGEYSMYTLMINEGDDENEAGTPSLLDSVYYKYEGMLLDGTVFDASGNFPSWSPVSSFVQGFSYGLTKFKGGTKFTNPDRTFGHTGYSTGYIFFPSGLGYRNSATGLITASSPLVFKIEVHEVNLSDDDADGIPTKYEILNNDNGTVEVIDTDKDGYNDYLDIDDDGDKILTIDEVDVDPKDGVVSRSELQTYFEATYPDREFK